MTAVRILARTIVDRAVALLPHRYSEWGEAMASELDHISHPADVLSWAAGCLRMAVGLRLTQVAARFSLAFKLFLIAMMAGYVLPRLPALLVALTIKRGDTGLADTIAMTFFGVSAAPFAAVVEQLTWVQLTSTSGQLALYSAAAIATLSSFRRAAAFYAAGLLIQSVSWLALWLAPAGALFSAAQWRWDLVVWLAMLTSGALLLWLSRREGPDELSIS